MDNNSDVRIPEAIQERLDIFLLLKGKGLELDEIQWLCQESFSGVLTEKKE